jgi:hypothetical protein
MPDSIPPSISSISSISATSKPSTYNPKNLWEDLIPSVSGYWDKNISLELKGQLVWAGVAVVALVFGYCLCLLISRYLQLHKPRHFLKVTLVSKANAKLDFASQFLTLLSKLHTLTSSSVVTFEIHKSNNLGGNFAGFIFTSTDLSVLEVIRKDLTTTDGVSAVLVKDYQDLLVEPLTTQFTAFADKLDVRPYQLQLLASSEFGNFRLDQNQLVKNLVDSLQGLEAQEYGSVVVSFRPVIKEHAIKSRIASLNFRSTKDADKYGVNQNMLAEVKELQVKNQYPLFQVRMVVFGSTRQIVNNLASSFNLLSQDNRLNERLANFNLKALRFIPKENLFKVFNRSSFGSLLNTRELASLVQLASFSGGGELRNKEGLKEGKDEREIDTSQYNNTIAEEFIKISKAIKNPKVSTKTKLVADTQTDNDKLKSTPKNRKLSSFK